MEEMKELVSAFKQYRDLLTPITANMKEFAETYDALKEDVGRLNSAFDGNVNANLDKIYKTLAAQGDKAKELSSEVDKFIAMGEKYGRQLEKLEATLGTAEKVMGEIDRIERDAEEQIGKLSVVLEEKRKGYNVKELERTIDGYNANVQKVSEFINKDVAAALVGNLEKLKGIKDTCEALSASAGAGGINELVKEFASTNALLGEIADNGKVNKEYVYDILDKWAEDRGVKRKK